MFLRQFIVYYAIQFRSNCQLAGNDLLLLVLLPIFETIIKGDGNWIWYMTYDVTWHDIWYDIWCDTIWLIYDMVWYGRIRYGMINDIYHMRYTIYDTWYDIWYDTIRYHMIGYDTMRCDTIRHIWYYIIWYMIWCDMIRYDTIW